MKSQTMYCDMSDKQIKIQGFFKFYYAVIKKQKLNDIESKINIESNQRVSCTLI